MSQSGRGQSPGRGSPGSRARRSRRQRFAHGSNDAPRVFAATAMLVTYALEKRSPWLTLAFAGSCLLASAYGFLQGGWLFAIIVAIWAGVAARRWYLTSWREERLAPRS